MELLVCSLKFDISLTCVLGMSVVCMCMHVCLSVYVCVSVCMQNSPQKFERRVCVAYDHINRGGGGGGGGGSL